MDIVIGLIAFVAGWHLCYVREREKLINYITSRLETEPKVKVVNINIEKKGDQLFAWRNDNQLFLGQYDTVAELEENVIKRIAATESGIVSVKVCDGYEYVEQHLAKKVTK